MAEVIKIEIPVSVQDKTDPALSNITKKLNSMAQASQKVSKIMMGGTVKKTGLDRSIEKLSQGLKREHQIEIKAHDSATPVLSEVEDRAAHVSGASAEIEISAENNASGVMGEVEDQVATVDGATANVEAYGEDNASDVMADVQDSVAATDGSTANVEAYGEDNASSVMADVQDAVAETDGNTANTEVFAEDSATDILSSIADLVASIDGLTAVVSVEARDNTGGLLSQGQSGGGGSSENFSMPSSGFSIPSAASGYAAAKTGLFGAAGFAGLSLGIGSAINSFKDFEYGMSEVKAISGATEGEFQRLTEAAKRTGATTKFTATESADALKYMAMAGWTPGDMEAGLSGIVDLAAASGESIGTASDIVTDALTAYGMTAEDSDHFADVLAKASASANTNVGEMGEAFKYVAANAGAMNFNIEDTAMAIGLMSNAGVHASMAGTALRRTISSLAGPTDKQAKAMEKYGISATKSDGKIKSLREVMDNLRDSLGGLSEVEQNAAVKDMFGQQASAGLLAIINASEEDYERLANNIDHAKGAAREMAGTMIDNLSGDMTLMSSAWEGVQNTFGERAAPHIRSIVQAITDAMPSLSAAINTAFDNIDPMIDSFKTKVGTMLSSEEWKNADGTDKINIAWDTLIAQPFSDWASSDGAVLISDTVSGLFSEAFKILPGGEEAGLTSWLSAGVIAIGAEKIFSLASGIGKLSEAVAGLGTAGTLFGSFTSGLGAAIPWIAGGAAALGLLNVAIDAYNQKQITNSISDHFGDIELSSEQIAALSDVILDIDWTANITVGLESVKEAETLRSDAEAKLKENDALEYEAKVGVSLTKDDEAAYVANCEAFVEDVKTQITKSAEGLTMIVDSMKIQTPEGGSLSDLIDDFAADDISELSTLQSAYKSAVENALSKGLQDVDANKAVADLEAKMQEIQDRWSNARQKAAEQMVRDTYTGKSGAELEGGTFQRLMEQMQADRTTTADEMAQGREAFYTHLYANEDRYNAKGIDINDLMDQWRTAEDYTNKLGLANALEWYTKSLNDAYADEIAGWNDNGYNDETARNGFVEDLNGWISRDDNGNVQVSREGQERSNDLLRNLDRYYNMSPDKGLQKLYQDMEPDVQEMQGIIDSYAAMGSEVPKALMDQYNAAIELGAAAGSESAGMQMFAKSLVEGGQQDLIDAIQGGLIGTDELRSALSRALLNPSEDMEMDLEGFKAKVGEIELDESSAETAAADLEEKTQTLIDSLSDTGGGYEITESGVEVSFEDVQVASDALGQSVTDFCTTYGIDAGTLEAEGKVVISADEVDMTMLEEAAQTAAEEATPSNIEQTAEAEVKVESASYDTSGLAESGEEQDLGTIPAKATAEVELEEELGIDESYSQLESDVNSAFSAPVDANSTSLTANAVYGGDNGTIAAAYLAFAAAAQAAFSVPVPVTGSISVSASTSGGVGGAAGNANGSYVDAPLLSWVGEDGPEFIIPVGSKRRERGIELWQQAGEALGVPGYADGGLVGGSVPVFSSGESDSYEENVGGSSEGISTEVSNGNGGGVTVQINLSPEFNLNDANENNVLAMIRAHMKELADDLGYEISEMLSEAYENRPVA